jgi:dihydroxyacid dehydratase/phosphogluconate dehydratase
MAAVRHNRPTVIVYGGTIQPGERHLGQRRSLNRTEYFSKG